MFGAQRWGGHAVGLGQCALLFSYPSYFFLSLWSWISSSAAVEMLCGASQARGTEGRTDSSLQTGSPGAALGVFTAGTGCIYNSFEYCWWWGCDWRFACPKCSWVLMRGWTEVNEPSALTLSFAGSSDRRVLPWECWGSELKCSWTLVAFLESAWDCAAGRKSGFLHREQQRERCL